VKIIDKYNIDGYSTARLLASIGKLYIPNPKSQYLFSAVLSLNLYGALIRTADYSLNYLGSLSEDRMRETDGFLTTV
jgi:hypothetical protein